MSIDPDVIHDSQSVIRETERQYQTEREKKGDKGRHYNRYRKILKSIERDWWRETQKERHRKKEIDREK